MSSKEKEISKEVEELSLEDEEDSGDEESTYETDEEADFDVSEVMKKGHLRFGSSIDNLEERYLVIRAGALYVYPKEDSHDTDVLIFLGHPAADAEPVEEDLGVEVFKLYDGESTFFFKAATKAERDAWVEGITATIAAITEGMKELTDEQKAKIAEMKEELKNEEEKRFQDDSSLLRILSLNKYNVEKSVHHWKEIVIWRKQYAVDSLTVAHVRSELDTGKFYYTGSKDKEGRPICVYRFARHDPKVSSPLDTVKLMLYVFERAIENMDAGVDKITMIADCKHLRMKNYDDRTEKLIFDLIQNRYPNRIGLIVIVNAPWFFRLLWKIIAVWMPKNLTSIIHVFKKRKLHKLYKFVPKDACTADYGGSWPFNLEEWIRKRYEIDGVKEGEKVKEVVDPTIAASLKYHTVKAKDYEDVVMSGWMKKKGAVVKNWKKRYFVLKQGMLYYFKRESSCEPKGIIILERCTVASGTGVDTKKENAVSVRSPLRTYVFTCKGQKDQKMWIEKLGTHLKEME